MTKEPADWAKIKAYRVGWPQTKFSDEGILSSWMTGSDCWHELARMYDQYEKPPVDPDLIAAREWCAAKWPDVARYYLDGSCDEDREVKTFLAGIKHGRANP